MPLVAVYEYVWPWSHDSVDLDQRDIMDNVYTDNNVTMWTV